MIDAEMRKKIRKSIDISVQEDVLTSNVFGLMSIVNNHLLTVLSNATHISSGNNLAFAFSGKRIKDKSFELWKHFDNKNNKTDKALDEPDVYFELDNGTKIIVEVKFWSGESDENQLKDYAMHCQYLIYLTQNQHQKVAKEKYKAHEQIYLLDWKEFGKALKNISAENQIESRILEKVKTYLDYKIDSFWDGWTIDCKNELYIDCQFYNLQGDGK
jgi:hypothetical protein